MAELCNGLSIPRALKLFVLAGDFRENIAPVGVLDGVNDTFTLPGGEKAVHLVSGLQIKLYRNGFRQKLGVGCDYTVSESGGVGTGFDTITVDPPPLSYEILLTDFVAV